MIESIPDALLPSSIGAATFFYILWMNHKILNKLLMITQNDLKIDEKIISKINAQRCPYFDSIGCPIESKSAYETNHTQDTINVSASEKKEEKGVSPEAHLKRWSN